MFEAIIRVLAPHYCIGCQREDTLLCEACSSATLLPIPSRCFRCKQLSPNHAVCSVCRRQCPIEHVWVGAEYTEFAQRLVHALKFERARAGVHPIARQINRAVPVGHWDTVVHLPTATSRVRQRGYDQAKLIAREFARRRKIPHRSLLVRHGHTRQVGAPRVVRLRQAAQFYSVKIVRPMPQSVLLIDDVTTTGASLIAAARCLKRAGVKHVDAAVFAQKN